MSNISQMRQAIDIIEKYIDTKNEWFAAEHDIIYVPLDPVENEVSDEDKQKLDHLGFFVEDLTGKYATFV